MAGALLHPKKHPNCEVVRKTEPPRRALFGLSGAGLTLLLALSAAPVRAEGEGAAGEAETGQKIHRAHAIAMHGEPKYGPDFTHFDYVNPDAPKGGTLRLADQGSFDSFNPWIPKGEAFRPGGDTLLVNGDDEPFTEYCLICETLEWPEDRSWVTFHLRPEARWHDGQPITPEDVIFSLDTIKEKGQPFYRFYYGAIERAEKVGPRSVKFVFGEGDNRELPLIAGQMPILPKHYWEDRDFSATTLEPPLTSGPYKIVDWEPGRYVVTERVEDYWAKDLPVRKGQYNFDRIRTTFFLDVTAIRQAVKAGQIDLRVENQAKAWATDYDIPVVRDGELVKKSFEHQRPAGMQAFVFNLRRDIFKDERVRQALTYAFDFEWSNPKLFFGQYTRNDSYFENSELASSGLPSGRELEILEGFRGRIPEEVFTQEFTVPQTDGKGWPRDNLIKASQLLEEAGWAVDSEGILRNVETGRPFTFEFLLVSPDFQRIVLPFKRNLKRLGIDMRVRLVDSSQYINRFRSRDYDMISGGWGQSNSPGNEQRNYWSSQAADQAASRNTVGIKDPVIDELIELIIQAPTREELVFRTRALDRVLLWGHYVIPAWHLSASRILYWDKFSYPDKSPINGTSTSYWWYDDKKATALATAKPGMQNTAAGPTDSEAAFDTRRLFGVGFFAILVVAVWFALRISGLRREERVAVIES